MSGDSFSRIDALFKAALDRPADQRIAFIESAAGRDATVAAEVRSLLAFHEREDSALGECTLTNGPAIAAETEDGPNAELPRRFGRYELQRIIGHGGMGVVYEARQDEPRRTVALKLIRPELATPSLLRRFRQEADLLARLQHPGIAHIYDAGMGEARQPYIAMEFVRGAMLTDFAQHAALSVSQKLELMAQVCDAVQHAHERGIVHRDLKPGNILVDGDAAAKVLDFGVARLAESSPDVTQQTLTGQLIGTMPYMSPEQIAGDSSRVDVRSDVYALGVILYELLSGRLPLDVRHRPIPEAARIIRDDDPTRLSLIDVRFRGDIETIVSKALEKEPQRRYPSAGALGADIHRFLASEPIAARPATALYQLRKFARRHRELVGGLAFAFAALVCGLIAVTYYAMRESGLRQAADASAARSDRSAAAARQAAYRAGILAASVSLANDDVAAARKSLSSAPAELRGWEWRHFHQQLEQSRRAIPDAALAYTNIELSDDAALVRVVDGKETGQFGGAPRAWNVETGAAATPPDGAAALRQFLRPTQSQAGWERMLRRTAWSVSPGREILAGFELDRYVSPDLAYIFSPLLAPDGQRFAFQTAAGRALHIIERVGDQTRHAATELPAGNTRLAFSPDSAWLWSADDGAISALRDGSTGAPRTTLSGHTAAPVAAAFSPDSARIVTGGWDNTLRLWTCATGAPLAATAALPAPIDAVAWSPDGEIIVSGSRDGAVRLWNADTLTPRRVLLGHESDVLSIVFSRTGETLATAARDGSVRIWQLASMHDASRDVLRGHSSYVYPVAFHPSLPQLASGSWDGSVRLWNLAHGKCEGTLAGDMKHVQQVDFSRDGGELLTWSDDGAIRIWSLDSATPTATLPFKPFRWWLPRFAPNGRVLLQRSAVDSVDWWDPATGQRSTTPLQSVRVLGRPLVSPNGRYAMLPGADAAPDAPRFELIDLESRQPLQFLSEPCERFSKRGVLGDFSPDSRYWLAARSDHTIRAIDLAARSVAAELRGHVDEVFVIAHSPDGRRIASGGRERTIRIWDAQTFEEVAQLRGHTSYIWGLAWSRDGTILASSSGDNTVRLWRAGAADE